MVASIQPRKSCFSESFTSIRPSARWNNSCNWIIRQSKKFCQPDYLPQRKLNTKCNDLRKRRHWSQREHLRLASSEYQYQALIALGIKNLVSIRTSSGRRSRRSLEGIPKTHVIFLFLLETHFATETLTDDEKVNVSAGYLREDQLFAKLHLDNWMVVSPTITIGHWGPILIVGVSKCQSMTTSHSPVDWFFTYSVELATDADGDAAQGGDWLGCLWVSRPVVVYHFLRIWWEKNIKTFFRKRQPELAVLRRLVQTITGTHNSLNNILLKEFDPVLNLWITRTRNMEKVMGIRMGNWMRA